MAQFRKKPVVIEAWPASFLLRCASHDWGGLPQRVSAAYDEGGVLFLPDSIDIATLEGRMTAGKDDMVICGVNGELYPCKREIFEKTYDPV
jgi:hypothetical protein